VLRYLVSSICAMTFLPSSSSPRSFARCLSRCCTTIHRSLLALSLALALFYATHLTTHEMANIKQHLLEVIRVDAAGIADALRCIFHSIVFNRMLGQVTPKEETTNVGFTYVRPTQRERCVSAKLPCTRLTLIAVLLQVRVDHPEVVERVNAAVDQVVAKVKAATVSHKLVLTLKHVTKGLIFSRTYDWEQWIVSVKLVSSPQSTEERGAYQCHDVDIAAYAIVLVAALFWRLTVVVGIT